MDRVDLSIVIPVLNEREALPDLIDEIAAACGDLGRSWEAIVVDDGSSDGSIQVLEELRGKHPQLRAVRLRHNFGKSAALATGFERSSGEVIVTIDGDGQDDPADIPVLLAALEGVEDLPGVDLVSGWKQERRDPWTRRLASRIFNGVTARFTKVDMHDMNCGFKAYRRECAKSLEIYGELHRFLPVLAAQQGWRVAEVSVHHRPRRHGVSRYGFERYLRGGLDLLTVLFIGRYQYRPLHLFGGIGVALTALGLLISAYLSVLKISGESIGQRPLLFLGVLLIVVGVQLLTFGLLAQMVVLARQDRADRERRLAPIERTVGFDSAEGSAAAGESREEALGDRGRGADL